MQNKLLWPAVAVLCSAIVAGGIYLGLTDCQSQPVRSFYTADSPSGTVGTVQSNSGALIAPHHGADNASSIRFIQAVSPQYVIFSAGHRFGHPRADTAQRYLSCGLLQTNMFRTDRGDDERRLNRPDQEWDYGRASGQHDPTDDDDVDIVIRQDGGIQVQYHP